METTLVTLANGRQIEVRGAYEDVRLSLNTRQLTADDGKRELIKADGDSAEVNIGAVVLVERATTQEKAIGFGRVLTEAAA